MAAITIIRQVKRTRIYLKEFKVFYLVFYLEYLVLIWNIYAVFYFILFRVFSFYLEFAK